MTNLPTKFIYKQKPLSLSSGLWALFVTALVLVMASSASAENTESGTSPTRPMLKREAVEQAPAVRPMDQRRATTTDQMLANQAARDSKLLTLASSTAARKAEWEAKRKELAVKFEERKTELAEKRAALASSTAARKPALAEKAQQHIKEAGERAEKILTKGIEKIRELSARLRARAASLADKGVDTTEVNVLLDEVDGTLKAAEEALADIEINVEYTAASEQPKNAWVDAKAQFQETRELVRQAHGLLREALAALKEAVREEGLERGVSEAVRSDKPKATSTASTTNPQ